MSKSPQAQHQEGDLVHGFEVLRTAPVASVGCTYHELRHQRLGTRHVHLASADDNNLFLVLLRTIPTDSTGVAHILEHSVLEGSRRYPIQTFKHLSGRTLHTFLNAMTSADYTGYPFATRDKKTWFALLDLYCDAVFHPLLERETFLQEAWRHEFSDPSDPSTPLVYRGVVYNEMKGALSNPLRLFRESVKQAILPDLTYSHVSGGDPQVMPRLTIEEWRAFHAQHYHPSNAFLFTYGSFPLAPTLEKIDRDFLAEFEPGEPVPAVPPQPPFPEPRRSEFSYPVAAGEEVNGRSIGAVAWRVASARDVGSYHELRLLSRLLTGNLSSPLNQALLTSGLGGGLAPLGLDDSLSEVLFGTGLKDMDPGNLDRLESLILETLEKVAREGVHPDELEASLHQLEMEELAISGGGLPYGWALLERALSSWLLGEDFLVALDSHPRLQELAKRARSQDLVPDLIHRYLLNNPHRATLLVSPRPGALEKREEELRQQLDRQRSSLTPEEVQELLDQYELLQRYQAREESLDCLPEVKRDELPREGERIPQEKSSFQGQPVYLHPQQTNGIGYTSLAFQADRLTPDELGALALVDSLPALGADGLNHTEMARLIHCHTGGVSVVPQSVGCGHGRSEHLLIRIGSSAFPRNFDRMAGILRMILTRPGLEDVSRIRELMGLKKAYLLPSVFNGAPGYLMQAAGRRISPVSRLRHRMGGLGQMQRILAFQPGDAQDWIDRLRTVLDRVVRLDGLTVGCTAEPEDLAALQEALAGELAGLPAPVVSRDVSREEPDESAVREAWVMSTPVSYVCRLVPAVSYEHPDAPLLSVLSQLMEKPLYVRVRAQGGAYGCWGMFDSEARVFGLVSFRDPHVSQTLDAYDQVIQEMAGGGFEDRELDQAVVETVRQLDQPLSPRGRGSLELLRRLRGLTWEDGQRFRTAVLDTTRADIEQVVSRYLVDPERVGISVLTSEEILVGPKAAGQGLHRRPVEPGA